MSKLLPEPPAGSIRLLYACFAGAFAGGWGLLRSHDLHLLRGYGSLVLVFFAISVGLLMGRHFWHLRAQEGGSWSLLIVLAIVLFFLEVFHVVNFVRDPRTDLAIFLFMISYGFVISLTEHFRSVRIYADVRGVCYVHRRFNR